MMDGEQFGLLPGHLLAGSFDETAKGDQYVGIDAEAEVVRRRGSRGVEQGRLAQLDKDLRTGHREALARANVKGHALPAPGVNVEPQADKGFDLGIAGHSRFVPIAAELAPDDLLRLQWTDGLEHLHSLVAD